MQPSGFPEHKAEPIDPELDGVKDVLAHVLNCRYSAVARWGPFVPHQPRAEVR